MKKHILYLSGICLFGLIVSCSDEYFNQKKSHPAISEKTDDPDEKESDSDSPEIYDFEWKEVSDFSENPDVIQTIYQEEKEYKLKFYYTSSTCIMDIPTYLDFNESIHSECGKLQLHGWDRDNLLPYGDLDIKKQEMLRQNPSLNEVSLYLVADFTFTYIKKEEGDGGYAQLIQQETEWEIVQGYLKDYFWEDYRHWQLVY